MFVPNSAFLFTTSIYLASIHGDKAKRFWRTLDYYVKLFLTIFSRQIEETTKNMELVLASILCVLVLQDRVFGLPVENGLRPKSPESLTATEFPAVQNEATSNTTEAPAMNHTFVKFDNLQNSEIVPVSIDSHIPFTHNNNNDFLKDV